MDDLLNTAAQAAEGVVEGAMDHVNAAVDNVQEIVETHTGMDTSAVDAMQEKAEDMVEEISAHDAEAPVADASAE